MNNDADKILNAALEKARSGRATEMTPEEMTAFREFSRRKSAEHEENVAARVAEARKQFSDKEREVHSFMVRRWAELDKDGASDEVDKKVALQAAVKFGITPEEANRIYIAVDAAGLDLD